MKTVARPAILIAVAITIMGSIMGCQTGYIIKSGYYELKMLSKRESLEKALKDPRLNADTKRKIELVQDVKKFAEQNLDLVHTKNYDSFVLLDQPYVVYAVTAAYKDRLEPYTWTFPIVGTVPYKGFFKKDDALDEMKDLEKKNLDVAMRGVSAFSTLGWFSDPLTSSMTAYDDMDLVDTIIHETTHATVYIKSNADFNERLATFTGDKGVEAYYRAKEGPDSKTVQKAELTAEDGKTFGEFISAEIKKAEDFYQTHKGSPTLMQDREVLFNDIQKDFRENCLPKLKTQSYHYFAKEKLNNAVLLSYKTYYQNLDLFQKAFEYFKGQWQDFIGYFKSIRKSKEPENDLRKLLGLPPLAPSPTPAPSPKPRMSLWPFTTK